MNATTIDFLALPAEEETLFERARHGDPDAAAALLDEIAPDVYGAAFLEVHDRQEAQRITEDALVSAAKSLRRGEIRSLRELRWRLAMRARSDATEAVERREQLAGVRASVRHLFGVLAVSGLALYVTVLAA